MEQFRDELKKVTSEKQAQEEFIQRLEGQLSKDLGTVRLQQRRFDEAREHYNHVLENRPGGEGLASESIDLGHVGEVESIDAAGSSRPMRMTTVPSS